MEAVEFVVQVEEGAEGYYGYEVRKVDELGNGEPIEWTDTYSEAEQIARSLNRELLGITVFPAKHQAWVFKHGDWPDPSFFVKGTDEVNG